MRRKANNYSEGNKCARRNENKSESREENEIERMNRRKGERKDERKDEIGKIKGRRVDV